MTDIIPAIAIISLCANAVLLIAYALMYRRAAQNDSRARYCQEQRDMWMSSHHRMFIDSFNSVRRDPKTGRYIKNRSN